MAADPALTERSETDDDETGPDGETLDFDALLEQQGGVISCAQAQARGCTWSRVRSHLRARRWRRLSPGVYLTHTGEPSYLARVWASLLWAGEGAVACHQTALWLADQTRKEPDEVHIAVPEARHLEPKDRVRVHRLRHPAARAQGGRQPPRIKLEATVLDLVHDCRRIQDAVAVVTDIVQRGKTTPARLRAELVGRPRLRWRHELELILADVVIGAQTPLELEHLRSVVRPHGLPEGRRQAKLGQAHWVDVLHEGVVIELDGRRGHDDARSKFRDMSRDNAVAERGLAHLRYGWSDVFGRPCEVAAQEAVVLAANGWTGSVQPCGPGCAVGAAVIPVAHGSLGPPVTGIIPAGLAAR